MKIKEAVENEMMSVIGYKEHKRDVIIVAYSFLATGFSLGASTVLSLLYILPLSVINDYTDATAITWGIMGIIIALASGVYLGTTCSDLMRARLIKRKDLAKLWP